jgi:hypothetical protein
VQGTIQTLELPYPTADEPENIEFFMEWDVPLECDAVRNCEDGEEGEYGERLAPLASTVCGSQAWGIEQPGRLLNHS